VGRLLADLLLEADAHRHAYVALLNRGLGGATKRTGQATQLAEELHITPQYLSYLRNTAREDYSNYRVPSEELSKQIAWSQSLSLNAGERRQIEKHLQLLRELEEKIRVRLRSTHQPRFRPSDKTPAYLRLVKRLLHTARYNLYEVMFGNGLYQVRYARNILADLETRNNQEIKEIQELCINSYLLESTIYRSIGEFELAYRAIAELLQQPFLQGGQQHRLSEIYREQIAGLIGIEGFLLSDAESIVTFAKKSLDYQKQSPELENFHIDHCLTQAYIARNNRRNFKRADRIFVSLFERLNTLPEIRPDDTLLIAKLYANLGWRIGDTDIWSHHVQLAINTAYSLDNQLHIQQLKHDYRDAIMDFLPT
jgi:hypothetical protein